jgi:putative membrane protein
MYTRAATWGTFLAPPPAAATAKTSDELAAERTSMAAQRTLMAADRSLMAWVRTGLSMISFGFTIYKILQGLAESGAALGAAAQPRVVGLFLIGLGTLSIVMGTVEYLHRARELSAHGDVPIWRPCLVMAALLMLLSLFLFFGVTFKVL